MLLPAILQRRAVRAYRPDAVSDAQVQDLLKAGQFAPTAHHSLAVEFLVVRDAAKKEALQNLLGQDFLTQAPVLIVPAVSTEKSVLPVQDLSVAAESIFLQAASMGLGTVWKNVAEENASEVKRILGIPETHAVIVIIPVGHPADIPPPHTDTEYEEGRTHWESW